MEFKGTPGPWKACFDIDDGWIIHDAKGDLISIMGTDSTENDQYLEADCNLIAAAPDMFSALSRVARLNENCGEIGEGMLRTIIEESRAVMEKALGYRHD